MKGVTISSVFLFIALFFYLGSILPALYGYNSTYSHYTLSTFNSTDLSSTYSLTIEKDGVRIYKIYNLDWLDNEITVAECSFPTIIASKNCSLLTIPDPTKVESMATGVEFFYLFIGIYPIVFIVLQIIIWVREGRSKHHHGEDYPTSSLFKYFRVSLLFINVSSIISTIIILDGFSTVFSKTVAIFTNPNIGAVFAYIHVSSTSLAGLLLIISLALVNVLPRDHHNHINKYHYTNPNHQYSQF